MVAHSFMDAHMLAREDQSRSLFILYSQQYVITTSNQNCTEPASDGCQRLWDADRSRFVLQTHMEGSVPGTMDSLVIVILLISSGIQLLCTEKGGFRH